MLTNLQLWSRLVDLQREGYADNPIILHDTYTGQSILAERVVMINGKPVITYNTKEIAEAPIRLPSSTEVMKALHGKDKL